jgi:hypothetical protein
MEKGPLQTRKGGREEGLDLKFTYLLGPVLQKKTRAPSSLDATGTPAKYRIPDNPFKACERACACDDGPFCQRLEWITFERRESWQVKKTAQIVPTVFRVWQLIDRPSLPQTAQLSNKVQQASVRKLFTDVDKVLRRGSTSFIADGRQVLSPTVDKFFANVDKFYRQRRPVFRRQSTSFIAEGRQVFTPTVPY